MVGSIEIGFVAIVPLEPHRLQAIRAAVHPRPPLRDGCTRMGGGALCPGRAFAVAGEGPFSDRAGVSQADLL